MIVTAPSQSRQFYIVLGLFMGLLAIAGFWPTYFGPLVTGTLSSPAIIHLHAAVFTGWLLLFLAQVVFAASGRVRLHIQLGRMGIWYGVGLIVVGLTTGVIRSRLPDGTADPRLFFSAMSDMAIFSAFFFSAIAYRKKPEVHRRAMVVAATMLLIAAVARLWFLPDGSTAMGFYGRLAIWCSPVLCAIGYDVVRRRGVHIVYVAGLVAFVLRRTLAGPISGTDTWGALTENVLSFWGV